MLTIWNYQLQFIAPAFLGDAEQNGTWRTPPLKAQLRQWWRMAYAADHQHRVDLDAMRQAEGQLFGVAADTKGDSRQSRVRLRLDRWDRGRLSAEHWERLTPVAHPEVRNAQPTADLYLGYGPVLAGRPPLKAQAAIQAQERAVFSLAVDERVNETERRRLRLALQLMHNYGTVGGRSRNGWGSYTLAPQGDTPAWPKLPETVLRPWRDALAQDWPHALGRDERGPLIWSTGAKADWRAAMVELARLKIRLRTALKFTTGRNTPYPEPRHWLAYPVTNHSVQSWGNARLPNTLRFKLRPTDHNQVEGLVFHVPALPPPAFNPAAARQVILDLWASIHRQLDQALPRAHA